jgi:hypothetical protein
VFLDVSQTFDRVWHSGLLYKIKQFLPPPYFFLLKSYLSDRQFQVRVGNEKFGTTTDKSRCATGQYPWSDIIHYTCDTPLSTITNLGIFADDTVILSVNEDPRRAASDLQHHLNTTQKGKYMNYVEKFHIYCAHKNKRQMNEILFDTHNPVFDIIHSYQENSDTNAIPHQ